MASIPYPDAFQQAQQGAHSPKGTVEPDATLVEAFYPQAKKLIVKGDYLRKKWQPLCGVRFYGLVKVLRAYCSYDIKDGEAMCFPSEETLARECKVNRRTIINWLQRSPEGRFARKVKLPTGEVRWEEWNWSALNQFLRIAPQLRYDPVGKRSVKTSNRYFIRMDDPPIPEDIPLIWAKARELAIAHLEAQAREQEQEARRQDAEARAARAASFGTADFTYNNVKKAPSEQCEKSAQDRLFSSSLITPDFYRSGPEGERTAQAIRNINSTANQQANKKGNEEDAASAASKSKSSSAAALHSEDQFRRAAPLDEEAERRREEQETALDAAYDVAGGVVASLLEELEATDVARGTRQVLTALVEAETPVEWMTDLAYVARKRVRDFVEDGGRIFDTKAGFYISTLRNLAHEARGKRRKGWDVQRIVAADRRKRERRHALAQRGSEYATHQATSRLAPRRERRPAPPTPAEAEALVRELGQQKETYAEAQAQVRRQQEERQAREARQQAIQQQAQLFIQLDQANQALQQHPQGSRAWERAQREKQEIERQIAVLRQPAGAPPEAGQQPPKPDRSEAEYREAIHAWARARGWTVRHGNYGGSQRDWQIGLMGVGKQELAQLAAELGV
jgi:hypothetical protein